MRIISCACKCRHDNAYISLIPRLSWSVEGRSGDETNTYICMTANILDVLFLIKYLIEIEMVKGRRRRRKEKGGVRRRGEGKDARGRRRERRKEGEKKDGGQRKGSGQG